MALLLRPLKAYSHLAWYAAKVKFIVLLHKLRYEGLHFILCRSRNQLTDEGRQGARKVMKNATFEKRSR